MKIEYEKIIIGYSGFVIFEEYYEYNENACYVADSRETCNEFMMIADRYDKSEFRIEEKSFQDLLDDFGVSCHQYVMEELAYEKFKKITQKLR